MVQPYHSTYIITAWKNSCFILAKSLPRETIKIYQYMNSTAYIYWGIHGTMVIVIENGHGNLSSNPGEDSYESNYSSSNNG